MEKPAAQCEQWAASCNAEQEPSDQQRIVEYRAPAEKVAKLFDRHSYLPPYSNCFLNSSKVCFRPSTSLRRLETSPSSFSILSVSIEGRTARAAWTAASASISTSPKSKCAKRASFLPG